MRKKLDKFATPKRMGKLAKNAANDVKKRTRLGGTAEKSGGFDKKLKPLSESYKRFRGGKQVKFKTKDGKEVSFKPKKPKMHSAASPKKSNLTFTGELLNSIRGKGVSQGKGLIYLEDNDRNIQIAKWQAKQGRTFMVLTNAQIKKITKELVIKFAKFIKGALS